MIFKHLIRYSFSNSITNRSSFARHFTSAQSSSSSSGSSSSDDDKKKQVDQRRSEEAKEKLNLLLNEMIKEDAGKLPQTLKLDLAKPKGRKLSRIKPLDKTEVKVDTEKQLLNAVKEVAKVVSGDVKQTESELLQKLLNPIREESAATTTNNLNELFKDMKIDRETKPTIAVSRAEQVRLLLQSYTKKQPPQKGIIRKDVRKHVAANEPSEDQVIDERADLFGHECLGIFPPAAEVSTWSTETLTKTWNALEERELRLAVTHPPANCFQQMTQWTEQGKIWRFPIDNEQDMESEKNVYFTEHVFLEKHIKSWCPPKGPLRHFMELVLVGLTKNPYLTAEHKKEHIEWFKNYFNEKQTLLHEIGAIPPNFEIVSDDTKKIES